MTLVSSGSGSLVASFGDVTSPMRLFFRTFRRWMEAADKPEASLLEDDSWPEENRWDDVVVAWAMWPLKKPQVFMMSPSRAVRALASAPLFISMASILPKAFLFCSKYLRHYRWVALGNIDAH